MDSQFSLRWSNYNDQIKDAFGSLLQEEDLVDVTLSCEGKKIKAHKMLLSACSPYFRDVFKDNPCQHPVIVFRNVTFADLKAIVEFVYCGEVTVSQDQIESFLNTAELLEIKGLSEKENEIDPIETVEISRDGESEQIDPIKEMPKKLLSRKQESHAAESSGRCSPPTKRKKSHKEESRVASPVVVISGEEPILVKEEALEIIDEPVVTDPLADSSLEPNPSSQEGLAENQGVSTPMGRRVKHIKSYAEKYWDQKSRCAERQRRYRAKMTEEEIEKKRRRDRERYYRLKREKKIKLASDMTERELKIQRKEWRERKAAYKNL